ncbi:hypothetical protein [Companilactobacillus kimchiensis]|uniref:GRAM domain-containing protein n=1 Tax=Companilactobacillus kimchiensis TaxID=993692 RepID=A0A0R2LID1_9LACO|nr:hypothetical protein [Companilactobacillus kimchiensis]KRN99050.1 hypothetical protein IV57_GL000620 [Companilactobacillus kimchiensis]
MFAYIEIIKGNESVSYGYSNFSFSNGILTIKPLDGMLHSSTEKIEVSKIANIKESMYYSWNRIQFDYNNNQYAFLYSGFGEYDYLKKNLMTEIMA